MSKDPKKESDISFIKKIKRQFKPTEITEADEAEFDICMKCGKRMPDRKLTTLRKHQQSMHPMSNKEKRSQFFYKHMLLSVLTMGLVVALILTYFPTFLEAVYDEETAINVEICTDRTIALKTALYEQGVFLESNVEDMNYIMQECNATFWSYKNGETLFDSDYYSQENVDARETEFLNNVKSFGGED